MQWYLFFPVHVWPSVGDSILCGKKKLHLVQLNVFRFLVGVARNLPKFWLRYPKHFIVTVMEAMIEVMSLNCNSIVNKVKLFSNIFEN